MAEETTIGGNGTLFIGEDKTIRLEVLDGPDADASSAPVNITGWTIKFFVKKSDVSTTSLIEKSAEISGSYNSVRASNTQRAVATLTDTDLDALKALPYRFAWKRMDADNETVLAIGNFIVEDSSAD